MNPGRAPVPRGPFADWKEERNTGRKWVTKAERSTEKEQGENPTEGADPEGGDS